MKLVIRKAFFDFEKEEKFLNDMSANGLALTDYSWCKYVFEDAPKNEYIYRLELLETPFSHPKSQEYIQWRKQVLSLQPPITAGLILEKERQTGSLRFTQIIDLN